MSNYTACRILIMDCRYLQQNIKFYVYFILHWAGIDIFTFDYIVVHFFEDFNVQSYIILPTPVDLYSIISITLGLGNFILNYI